MSGCELAAAILAFPQPASAHGFGFSDSLAHRVGAAARAPGWSSSSHVITSRDLRGAYVYKCALSPCGNDHLLQALLCTSDTPTPPAWRSLPPPTNPAWSSSQRSNGQGGRSRTRMLRRAPVVSQVAKPNGRAGSCSYQTSKRWSARSRLIFFSSSIHT